MITSWSLSVCLTFVLIFLNMYHQGFANAQTEHGVDESLPRPDDDTASGTPEEFVKRHIGRWKNANRYFGKREEDEEYLTEKRNLGRWRNRNWILNSIYGDQNGDGDGEQLGGKYLTLVKRSLGRWRNMNYKTGGSIFTSDDIKRSLGRWRNRNYQNGGNVVERYGGYLITKRNLGRWRYRNWLYAKRFP